jgi:hypothetical protein
LPLFRRCTGRRSRCSRASRGIVTGVMGRRGVCANFANSANCACQRENCGHAKTGDAHQWSPEKGLIRLIAENRAFAEIPNRHNKQFIAGHKGTLGKTICSPQYLLMPCAKSLQGAEKFGAFHRLGRADSFAAVYFSNNRMRFQQKNQMGSKIWRVSLLLRRLWHCLESSRISAEPGTVSRRLESMAPPDLKHHQESSRNHELNPQHFRYASSESPSSDLGGL